MYVQFAGILTESAPTQFYVINTLVPTANLPGRIVSEVSVVAIVHTAFGGNLLLMLLMLQMLQSFSDYCVEGDASRPGLYNRGKQAASVDSILVAG